MFVIFVRIFKNSAMVSRVVCRLRETSPIQSTKHKLGTTKLSMVGFWTWVGNVPIILAKFCWLGKAKEGRGSWLTGPLCGPHLACWQAACTRPAPPAPTPTPAWAATKFRVQPAPAVAAASPPPLWWGQTGHQECQGGLILCTQETQNQLGRMDQGFVSDVREIRAV